MSTKLSSLSILQQQALRRPDHFAEVTSRPITMALAKEFHEMTKVPGERKLKASRIATLKRDINSGKIIPFEWKKCLCIENEREYRLNGQHTAELIVRGEIPVDGTAVIQTFMCDTLNEVIRLWSIIDNQKSGRTKTEVFESMIETNEELADLPLSLMQGVANAVCIALFGNGYSDATSHVEKAEILLQHVEFAKWCHSIFPATETYAKVGVLYAAWITYNLNEEKAKQFWTEVVKAAHLDEKSPSLALHNKLLQGFGLRREKNSVQWHDFSNLCLNAWRSWMAGKKVSSIVMGTEGIAGLERFITQEKSGKIISYKPSAKVIKS